MNEIPYKKVLTARYYSETNTIAIYNYMSKLIEINAEDREFWGLPSFFSWKTTSFGCEQEFIFKPVY